MTAFKPSTLRLLCFTLLASHLSGVRMPRGALQSFEEALRLTREFPGQLNLSTCHPPCKRSNFESK